LGDARISKRIHQDSSAASDLSNLKKAFTRNYLAAKQFT
jgi:hypothetical protein